MVHIERLTTYSPEDAESIGRLMPILSERLTEEPIDEKLLREIIDSPYHDQLVARQESRIVGAATLSVIYGTAAGKQGWLNDFVTARDTRGVGTAIWDEMGRWCNDNDIHVVNFTSNKERIAAHHFYEHKGAKIRTTTVYRKLF